MRYILAVLGSIAMGIVYGLKVNLSVAIVAMVNQTAVAEGGDHEGGEDGPFTWDSTVQGLLKSAYFWGYLVAQLPAARIAELFSAKWVMFFSVFINVVCTILSPVAAKWHYGAFLLMRILEGIGGGVTFPGMHVLLSRWAPPTERSVMSSIVYAGTALGTVIFTLVTGLISSAYGWEAIFYIEGICSAVWLLVWFILASDSPSQHNFISPEERHLITSSLNEGDSSDKKKNLAVPWKAVLTSPAFLAILVAHTCCNWGWYMVLIELPHYMSMILKYKIADNAVISSIPYFTMWIFSMILSKTLDVLRGKHKITTTTARKISTLIASIVPLVSFVTICYSGDDRTLVTVLMTIAITAIGGMFSGYLSNHIDIAPNFAGTLVAITNTCATVPGIVVPVFVGELTQKNPTIESWQIVFWITVTLYAIATIVYGIFGSGEEQKWNKPNSTMNETQPLRQL